MFVERTLGQFCQYGWRISKVDLQGLSRITQIWRSVCSETLSRAWACPKSGKLYGCVPRGWVGRLLLACTLGLRLTWPRPLRLNSERYNVGRHYLRRTPSCQWGPFGRRFATWFCWNRRDGNRTIPVDTSPGPGPRPPPWPALYCRLRAGWGLLERPGRAAVLQVLQRILIELLATSKNETAIIFPGPSRVGSDPKWDRRSAFNVICRPRSRGGPTRPPTR